MSDYIPFEIQSEIIKRLPVKSVVQCRYVSFADDDTFPNHKSSLTVPQPVSQLGYISTLNSANGLLCFYSSRQDVFDEKIVVLWNPSIGKAVGITISNSLRPLTVLLVLGSHEFGEVCLPDRLVRSTNGLAVPKVYESLGLFEYYNDGETRFCDVRIMKEGVTKSFTKMLSIKAPDSLVSYRVLELRKNGEVIIENIDDTNSSAIEVYSDNLVI
ncbi:hypothetical protein Tco_0632658 [Tanacetum coccineum]